MLIYVDIDETICRTPESRDYSLSVPLKSNIAKINELFDSGNRIVYWTARGGTSGIDWAEITELQLKKWGVKYHELRMRKPSYDLFICDKAINSERFFNG